MTRERPADAVALRDVDPEPLSAAAQQAQRRATLFFFALTKPALVTRALLCGLQERDYTAGLFLLRHVNGEGPFGDWRRSWVRKPRADPDLPELVAELDAFAGRWRRIALAIADRMSDRAYADEMHRLFGESDSDSPSRVRRARALVRLLESTQVGAFYAPMWEGVVAAGLVDELPRFRATLSTVEEFMRDAPLDDSELTAMHASREAVARSLGEWLDARARQLSGLDELELTVMGLGMEIPSDMPDTPSWVFNALSIDAKA